MRALELRRDVDQGQADRRVKFLSRGSGYTLLLTGDEAVLALRSRQSSVASGQLQKTKTTDQGLRTTDAIRMKLVSANRSPRVMGLDELPGRSNYFIGSDPAQWRTDVRTYAKVKYAGVYPGIDLIYYGNSNPGPWNPDQRPGDNKWTSSIFARRPDTGEVIWAYQYNHHDLFDYDAINENTRRVDLVGVKLADLDELLDLSHANFAARGDHRVEVP